MKRSKTDLYYKLDKILKTGAHYCVVIGERSNGKTYAALTHMIENYWKNRKQSALIRRFNEDFTGGRGQNMFYSIAADGLITKITDGEWDGVYYFGKKWYLCRASEEGERIKDEQPFCYGFSLSAMEHDKGSSYPNVTFVVFDEFMTRDAYLTNEFVLFCNVISTIVRQRDDVRILMLANTVSLYCPYFLEMGLSKIKEMEQGQIDVYHYGDSDLTVAVEYCANLNPSKASNVYFAFDNPRLQMIKTGSYELELYPHAPGKWRPKDIVFTWFIDFNNVLLQCEVIKRDNELFTFIHRKTSELKNTDTDLIYSPNYDTRPNWRRNLLKPTLEVERRILQQFREDKVFYQDNVVGELVRNYLQWCRESA